MLAPKLQPLKGQAGLKVPHPSLHCGENTPFLDKHPSENSLHMQSVGVIVIPVLQLRRLRPREVK